MAFQFRMRKVNCILVLPTLTSRSSGIRFLPGRLHLGSSTEELTVISHIAV